MARHSCTALRALPTNRCTATGRWCPLGGLRWCWSSKMAHTHTHLHTHIRTQNTQVVELVGLAGGSASPGPTRRRHCRGVRRPASLKVLRRDVALGWGGSPGIAATAGHPPPLWVGREGRGGGGGGSGGGGGGSSDGQMLRRGRGGGERGRHRLYIPTTTQHCTVSTPTY